MSSDMEPSTTMKFLLPFVLTPVTVLTNAEDVATMDRPGSMICKARARREQCGRVGYADETALPAAARPCPHQREPHLLDGVPDGVDQVGGRGQHQVGVVRVVDAQAAPDVQVLDVEALVADLLEVPRHDLRRVLEDVDLRGWGGPALLSVTDDGSQWRRHKL